MAGSRDVTDHRVDLTRYAWLSIAAAVVTISLKGGAWLLTSSVGLLSDAAESVVNLVAAIAALIALRVAARPADEGHPFGHTKAEYFSAAIEGALIFVAAVVIIEEAVSRFAHPQPLDNVGAGLAISCVASAINGGVAVVLLRAGARHNSITLRADGKHLMTDVWTSVGVVLAVLLVALTGIQRLDPVIAVAVGVNIIVTGWHLLNESSRGLMDGTMTPDDNARIASIVGRFQDGEVDFHGLRTRMAGRRGFAEMHVLVPGAWSVQRGHDIVEDVEEALRAEFPDIHVMCHLEPVDDPRSYGDFDTEIPVRGSGPDGRELP